MNHVLALLDSDKYYANKFIIDIGNLKHKYFSELWIIQRMTLTVLSFLPSENHPVPRVAQLHQQLIRIEIRTPMKSAYLYLKQWNHFSGNDLIDSEYRGSDETKEIKYDIIIIDLEMWIIIIWFFLAHSISIKSIVIIEWWNDEWTQKKSHRRRQWLDYRKKSYVFKWKLFSEHYK